MRERVHAGNDQFIRGDKIERPRGGGQGGGSGEGEASQDGEGGEICIPDFQRRIFGYSVRRPRTAQSRKNQINKITEWKTHRAGYQTAGSASNIAIVRSLQQSLARHTA